MTTQTNPSPHARKEVHQPILTVSELQALLNTAVERGLHPDTAVVIARDGWYDEVLAAVEDPTDPSNDVDMWFTLTPAGPADARFTPGHQTPRAEDLIDPSVPVIDLVAGALQAFWDDEHLSYKAGDYDVAHYVAVEVSKVRPDMLWSDAALRRAADLSFVVGQFGVDQKTDRQYHAMMAVAIFETEDVL